MDSKKRVAVVHDFTVRFGGAERLVVEWCKKFDADLFTLFYDEKKMGRYFEGVSVTSSYLQKFYNLGLGYYFLLPFMGRAIQSFDLSEYDVVLSSSAAFSHGTRVNARHVSYVHSPARWAFDYHDEFMKERKMGRVSRFIFERIIKRFKKWDLSVVKNADEILCPSNVVKDRILQYWNVEAEVVAPFVDTDKFDIGSNEREYFLVVAQLVPYKRIDIAIEACKRLGLKLKIVGEGMEGERLRLREREEEGEKGKDKGREGGSRDVEFLGRLDGDDLVKAYQGAKALLFTSVDDFGMTGIEAMACGVPVVALKKAGALDWMVDGVTGEFFEKQDVASLASVLEDFDPNKYEASAIRNHALNFSLEKHLGRIESCLRKI